MNQLYGNAVVGQSGGPTAAINATLAGVIRGVLEDCHGGHIKTLYGMKNGIEGLLCEDLIDLSNAFAGPDMDALDLLIHTPAAALGSCRKKLPAPDGDDVFYEKLIAIFKKYDIRYFFYIGGNDSMDTVAKLSEYTKHHDWKMVVMGVPKTIDNDLEGTDHTPGFGSAAKYIAVTMQEILRDCAVYTVPAVTIVEIMGRDAGWLTTAAAVGKALGKPAPDYVYLPERTFDLQQFFSDVKAALARHPNVVIAISEGIRFADGRYVGEGVQSGAVDAFGHTYLAGAGKALELAVKAEIGCKVRSVELNLPQRCASHLASQTDLDESVEIGSYAVLCAGEGITRQMITVDRVGDASYKIALSHTEVEKIANRIKKVPDAYINEAGNHITDAACRYLLPLIQGEVNCRYQNGLPEYIIL